MTAEPISPAPAAAERPPESTGLTVLSFGSTRGLWDGPGAEDYQRLLGYAAHLARYVVVANSYKKHGLQPRRFGSNLDAIPTDAHTPFDSLVRMFVIGWRACRDERVDLIQAQDPLFLGLLALALGRVFRIPVNVCLYGPNGFDPHWVAAGWGNRLTAPLARFVLRRAQGIQTDGQMTARSLLAAGIPAGRIGLKPVVPANLDRFLALERTPFSGPARLLFVGRFAAQKNLPLLLDVLRRLKAAGHRFTATLVGEGPLAAELRALTVRRGLEGDVTFHPPVSRDRIPSLFAAADLFLLTSDYEGYPRVLMEAAASAIPVVTTAVSGSDDAVADGTTGFIVPVRDAEALAAKAGALIADPALRAKMGAAARQHIRERLDPAKNTPGQVAIWKRAAAAFSPAQLRPRRLLLFNLVTDLRHPVLGFTTQWIRELAARVDSIDVLTMYAGDIDVPANVRVHSAGRERGYSEPRRVLEFYRHLFHILRTQRIDGCFSHMMQIFSVMAGPVLRAAGIPIVTWYAHPSLPLSVKLAHFASDRMVTSLPGAYPYRRDKLAVIGQGIDTGLFSPGAPGTAPADTILCVGRISRVKDHPTLLRAFARLPAHLRLVILGATSGPDDEAYAAELRQLAAELRLESRVTFARPVPPSELPAEYRRCTVHVNLTPAGFGDKVAWEAMSCGRPCLVANPDFRETLGAHADALLFRHGDDADLARKLEALLAQPAAARDAIGADLRTSVERLHSLPRLAERILDQIAECRAARP